MKSMILAEAQEHGYAGDISQMVFLGILALVLIVAAIAVLTLLLRGKSRPEDASRTPSAAEPQTPPTPDATTRNTHPSSTDSDEDPKQAMQKYFDREDEIMAVLKQKGRPVTQSELCQSLGLTADELARALSDLEQRAFLRRTWDRERQDFMVRRQES